MKKLCVITEEEVEREKLTQGAGLFVTHDNKGGVKNLNFVNNYVMRRLRESGITFGQEKWRKFKDERDKCVWIAEEK